MTKRYIVRASIALLAVMLLAAACGGDDDKKANTPAAAATAPTSGVDRLRVIAKDFAFTTDLTSVRSGPPGVLGVLQNSDTTSHSVAFYTDAAYQTKLGEEAAPVVAGGASTFEFIVPADVKTVFFRCEIHPTQMQGELPVE